ncbi:hypothetical protein JXA88_08570 [Candidatus Fermentibacteria bacterium]|nr:hypothetical protein [Candidatus Fermentibacteria bacterium]
MRPTTATSAKGTALLEVLLALAILSTATLAIVQTVSSSRRAASAITARASVLSRQIRGVSGMCRWRGAGRSLGALDLQQGRSHADSGVESWQVHGSDEALMVMRFSPDSTQCVVCGVPGSKRWLS